MSLLAMAPGRPRPSSRPDDTRSGASVFAIGTVCVTLVMAVGCSKHGDDIIPVESKARDTWMQTVATKLSTDQQRTLARFAARLDARTAAGGADSAATGFSVPRALELQTAYEASVTQAQAKLQKQIELAKADVTVEVVDTAVVKAAGSAGTSDKALRFAVRVNNHGKRVVDHVAMRIEIRESGGNYQAAIPNLDLRGPLRPGEWGRSIQTYPLDRTLHRYILDGNPVRIVAYPVEIAFSDGTRLAPGDDLKTLESLHNAKVE